MEWIYVVAAAAAPSICSGIALRFMQIKLDKVAEEAKKHEQDRVQYEMCIMKMSTASMALAEATAKAVQRIPDAKCNGDMHEALDYAKKVKNETKDFVNQKAVEHFM
ncbi:serine/threonine protein kinase [Chakrabartyella piscis]|uniref:serine/threonine protein kinase n=1 Tax=Chakrabartyella piscis TaxID=2918914 RepID=UPI002958608A|nr:serine/threonine protein kinase [Chakrabartyella piscis]